MAFRHAPDGPGPDKDAAIVFLASKLRVRLTDPDRNPVAGGRCRVAGAPDVVYDLDGDGIADIPLKDRSQKTLELEWGPPEGGDAPFPWSNVFDADIRTAQDEDCSRRLTNLGFLGEALPEQVDAYLDFLGLDPAGDIGPYRNDIVLLHDDGKALARRASGAKGVSGSGASSSDAKALVEKLYRAFNDPGFLGLGGTDEEGVFEALRTARDQGIMRDVDALYAKTYPTELNLKDELDDELSGDDFDRAMAYYNEGMQAQPGAQAAAGGGPGAGGGTGKTQEPRLRINGTLAPLVTEDFSIYLLDFDMQPMPGAMCRMADFPDKVAIADADGLVTLPFPQGRETVDIEWTRPGTDDDSEPRFILKQTVYVDFSGTDDAAVSKQLANLGFDGEDIDGQMESFQAFLGGAKDEGFRTARADLDGWIKSENAPFPARSASGGNSRTV